MSDRSHRAVIRDVASEYDLYQEFVKGRAPIRAERQKMTLLHTMAGKMPEKTGRYECDHCNCLLTQSACGMFADSVESAITRILKDYYGKFCPECGDKYTGKREVEIVEPGRVMASADDMEPSMPDVERKVEYSCGCRFEPGEEEILGALDRHALNEDARDGQFYGWDSDAAKMTSEIEEAING